MLELSMPVPTGSMKSWSDWLHVERRWTDTQDVMLALSEKLDHWEQESRRSAVGSAENV